MVSQVCVSSGDKTKTHNEKTATPEPSLPLPLLVSTNIGPLHEYMLAHTLEDERPFPFRRGVERGVETGVETAGEKKNAEYVAAKINTIIKEKLLTTQKFACHAPHCC